MPARLQDSRPQIRRSIGAERELLGPSGVTEILDQGRQIDLPPVLENGGSLLFPHTFLRRCGAQVAACVHALLDSGADQALLLGVLHPAGHLGEASLKVAGGSPRKREATYGIQGPGLDGRSDWIEEFSLHNFCYLLEVEGRRRGIQLPKLAIRYPFLVGKEPSKLPGIREVEALARDSVVLATGDLLHHGEGYGTPAEEVVAPQPDGFHFARGKTMEALTALGLGDYGRFLRLSESAFSDWGDGGPVLRHLLGPFTPKIVDFTWADTNEYYNTSPNWVAASLVVFDVASDG